jgi:UDP-N-acetylmuramate dehydrogenase
MTTTNKISDNLTVFGAYPLAPHTSWLVGGNADWAVLPKSVLEIREACMWAKKHNLPITILGGGTNVLVSDKGVAGLTILMKDFTGFTTASYALGALRAEAWAGTPKAELLKVFIKHRLSPAVFLAGLPGDIGGGVVMNAGIGHDVQPKEFSQIIDWVEYIDLNNPTLKVIRKEKEELDWQYRHSSGWQPGIITQVGIIWREEPNDDVLRAVQDGNKRRMATQPLQSPSCGSVFKNPVNRKAGALIEACGLKGFTIGGAQVSDKHANFIINTGKATAADITAVREHVQKVVNEQTRIPLEVEYKFIGRA